MEPFADHQVSFDIDGHCTAQLESAEQDTVQELQMPFGTDRATDQTPTSCRTTFIPKSTLNSVKTCLLPLISGILNVSFSLYSPD